MNRDCFQDQEVAELLNRYFIPIKVDREERPDIDHVYIILQKLSVEMQDGPKLVLNPR